jgi:hypothetical protein
MVVQNTTAYTWDWYSHLVGDRASLKNATFSINDTQHNNAQY